MLDPPAGGVERAVAGHRPRGGALASPRGLSAGGKATGSCTFTSRRRCGRWGCTGDGRRGLRRGGLADQNGRLAIAAPAPVGAVCTLVALVSGAAWGKPMWGTWWIWDARLTSELVLLFLYAGVIALWHAFDDRRLAGRAAGILVLVGVVNLPIIHYSVYWWNTLHRGLDQPAANHRPKHASAAADLHLCLPHAVGHPDPDAPA